MKLLGFVVCLSAAFIPDKGNYFLQLLTIFSAFLAGAILFVD